MINKTRLILTVFIFISLVPVLVLAGVIDLPVTGQTKCYDPNGAEISCAGTGQDGDVRAGAAWPDPRFTNPDGSTPINSDCILDRLTGLMWPRNAYHGSMPWYQAIDYANNFILCGYSDWFLPNVNELESLINANEPNSAIWLNSQGFYSVQSDFYWSSTSYGSGYAWFVYMGGGNVYNYSKDNYYNVWPARSAHQSEPDPSYPVNLWETGQKISYYTGDDGDLERGVKWSYPRFMDNNDGTVTDNLTGLMWLKDADCMTSQYPYLTGGLTWEEALDFVKGINNGTYPNCSAGYYDWRMPNRKEIMSLTDRSQSYPALPAGFPFINVQPNWYWTSTISADFTKVAWDLRMWDGYLNVFGDYDRNVWPVRGGQVGAPVNYYCDNDSDGYRATLMEGTCTGIGCVPAGCLTGQGNDCNDNDYNVNPGKTERFWGDATCTDGKDNNCNGFTDASDSGCQSVNADLVITVVTGPATGVLGSNITVGDTTKNNGLGSVPASTTKFYWSTNIIFDAGDTYLGSRAVPVLSTGASNTGSISVIVPGAACSGTSYIIARADADNVIAETNETNNTRNRSIKAGVDLIVYSLAAPAISGTEKGITVTDTTKNQGGCPATASTTKLYLSANSTWDAGDAYLGERTIPALAAGTADTGSTSVTIPAGTTTGSRYIIAKSDADNTNPNETSETNNNKTRSIKIGPDVIVSLITASTSAVRGSTISVTDVTRNQAGGDAEASTTKLYLSSNTTYDAADTYLGERAVPALAAGVTSSGSTNATIPEGIAAGTYYIIAVSDADAVVTETSETNNNKYKLIAINP